MPERIPHSRPTLGLAEERAVARVLRSGQLAAGPEVERLEATFAERHGFAHAVATSSGTAALHLALLAVGARPGRRVLIPSYVCVALLHAVRYSGAEPQLLDTVARGFHPDLGAAAGPAKVAIVPHLFGYPCDVRPLLRAGVTVIEDCAMALGATLAGGAPVGRRGAAAIFSFYATKMVAAGEGGMLATDDAGLAAEVRDRREYDKRDDARLRFNYKLSDLQAALVRSQLERLPRLVRQRREIAARYFEELSGLDLVLPPRRQGAVYHRFVVRHGAGFAAAEPALDAAGIDVARPVHRPIHRLLELAPDAFPRAERLFLTAISVPIYPTLSASDRARITTALGHLGR